MTLLFNLFHVVLLFFNRHVNVNNNDIMKKELNNKIIDLNTNSFNMNTKIVSIMI
jgi:hypothetical protein